jgi:hypothetical protein
VPQTPILVVDIVPVNGTQATNHLPEARQECNLHEEVSRQASEDKPVEDENATHVEEVEHEKAAMCEQEDIVPFERSIWRILRLPFIGNPNDWRFEVEGEVRVIGHGCAALFVERLLLFRS